MVERAKLQQIQAEQDLNASNRAAQGKGARIGKIRGADAILMGDITVFGRDDKKTNIKGGGLVGSVIGGIAPPATTALMPSKRIARPILTNAVFTSSPLPPI